MSDYPNYASEPITTKYEGFEIAVRTSTHTWGHALNEVSGHIEITKDGKELLKSSIAGGHPSADEAAVNALRIAKIAIFEQFDGPDPDVAAGV